jgi:sigma-E factor negative regulatory protein RseB
MPPSRGLRADCAPIVSLPMTVQMPISARAFVLVFAAFCLAQIATAQTRSGPRMPRARPRRKPATRRRPWRRRVAAAHAHGSAAAQLRRNLRGFGAGRRSVERTHLACARRRSADRAHRGPVGAAALDIPAQPPRHDLPARGQGRESREAREPRPFSQSARQAGFVDRRFLRRPRHRQRPCGGFRRRRGATGAARCLRFGYRIWSERRSGLVVKLQTLDGESRVVEQSAFSELQLDAPVKAQALRR